MKFEISESESQRAERQIDRFYQKHGGIYYDLAAHAAYPFLNLTSDLVYCLRENFVPQAPWIAISDILLSPLCQNLGGDLYEMDPAVRMRLCQDYWDHAHKIDCQRLEELNDFATQYLNSQRNNRLLEYIGDSEKFAWCKSGLRDYHKAADQLVSKLQAFSENRKYIDFFHWLKFYKIEKNVVDYEFLEKILPLSVRWKTSLGKAAIDLDEDSLSEQLRSILPYSEDLSIEIDGNSILVKSNEFNYMMFKNLVESDEILGELPQPINIKRVLIVTSNSSLSRAISRAFDISFNSLKIYLKIDWASEFENAVFLLDDQNFDLVITADNLEYSGGHKIYDGLRLCNYMNINYPNILKIIIFENLNPHPSMIFAYMDAYKVEDVFFLPEINVKSFVDQLMALLQGTKTSKKHSPDLKLDNFNQSKSSITPLIRVLEKRIEEKLGQLELLDQKISQFERGKIIGSHLPSQFELEQNISDSKLLRNTVEQEIIDLNEMLLKFRQNSD